MSIKKTTKQFIIDAKEVHGNKYDYSLVDYKNNKTKVKIICNKCNTIFEQTPNNHLRGHGCPECKRINSIEKQKKSVQKFIMDAKIIHNNKYDYSLVEQEGYKNNKTKVKIICNKCNTIFIQRPDSHLNGQGCPKCVGKYKEKYAKNNIPLYDTYAKQLQPYGIECRRNKEDNNILEVKCMYCDRWYIPSLISVKNKIRTINGNAGGEQNLYCSDECKHACPTYKKVKYPKYYKVSTSREVQPALRKLVLKRDNYTCQKCNATDVELHCHHYEGIEVNPVESADIDNCITLCIDCHHETHSKDKCGIKDYKRKEC